jgi:hypothetical protein
MVNGDYDESVQTFVMHALHLIVNILCLALIGGSNVIIITSISKSRKAIDHVSTQSKVDSGPSSLLTRVGVKLAIFMLVLLMAWLPALVMDMLVLAGAQLSESTLAWLTVLATPLTALLNPILYTWYPSFKR